LYLPFHAAVPAPDTMIASSVLVLNQPVVDAVVAVVVAALVVSFWVVAVAAVLVLVTRSSV